MKAYLDTQIIDGIEKFKYSVDGLITTIDKRINQFPYSSAHIYEAEAITGKSQAERELFIDNRLTAIECISDLLYMEHDRKTNTISFNQTYPQSVFETISENIYIAKPAMIQAMNVLDENTKTNLRRLLNKETRELNNMKPEEVVEQLSPLLSLWGSGLSFTGLIDKAIRTHPDGASFGLHNKIVGVFELIDLMGYWKDKATETSNYARLWDGMHAYFASECDYLVSDDKRMRYKAKVAYDLFGITTKVVSANGLD